MINLKEADRDTIVGEILSLQTQYAQVQADIAHVGTTLSARRKQMQYSEVASRDELASQYADAVLAGEEMPKSAPEMHYDIGSSKLIISGLEMKVLKLEQQAQIIRGDHRRAVIALAEYDAQNLAKAHQEAREQYIQSMADIMAISLDLSALGLPTTAQLHPAMISSMSIPMLTSEIHAGGGYVPSRLMTGLVETPLRTRRGKYSERLNSAGIVLQLGK